MDWLVNGAIAIAGAVVAGVAATFVTKRVSGKHIHEHVFAWWARIRDSVLAWAHRNEHLEIQNVVVWLDNRASAMAHLVFEACTRERDYKVTEEDVTMEEAYKMFPHLRTQDGAVITAMVFS